MLFRVLQLVRYSRLVQFHGIGDSAGQGVSFRTQQHAVSNISVKKKKAQAIDKYRIEMNLNDSV